MPESNPKSTKRYKSAKQVLITIDRAGLDDWLRFEEYCKNYKINKSRLLRQLANGFLLEQSERSEPRALLAGGLGG